uniref:Uncharacterized protein n=1 Tax=Erwinia amylovora TaxID=552 RepID=A0A0P0ZGQ5_ERWAM|nr:hypothetical protein EAMY692_p10006 [Erwinia amylovora]
MEDLFQVFFSQTGQVHYCRIIQPLLQHGTRNFKGRFTLTFCTPLLPAFLLQLLCNRHQFIPMLRHSLRQVAYEGFGVVGFARLYAVVYQRNQVLSCKVTGQQAPAWFSSCSGPQIAVPSGASRTSLSI